MLLIKIKCGGLPIVLAEITDDFPIIEDFFDDNPASPLTRNLNLGTLPLGDQELLVTVYDRAGNTNTVSKTITISSPLDVATLANGPDIVVVGEDNYLNQNAITKNQEVVIATSPDGTAITYNLQEISSGTPTSCDTIADIEYVSDPILSGQLDTRNDGDYQICVKLDKAPYETKFLEYDFIVDATAPVAASVVAEDPIITYLNQAAFEVKTLRISEDGSGLKKVEYQIYTSDGSTKLATVESTTFDSEYTNTGLLDLSSLLAGEYLVKAKVYDNVENFAIFQASSPIERVPPQKLIITNSSNSNNASHTPTITINGAEAGVLVTITATATGQVNIINTFTVDSDPSTDDDYTFQSPLAERVWSIVAIQTDSARINSEESDPLTINLIGLPTLLSLKVINDHQVTLTMDEPLNSVAKTDISATGGGFTFTNEDATISQPNFITINGDVVTLDFTTGTALTVAFTYSYAKPQNPLITDIIGNALENIAPTEHIGFTLDFNGKNGFQVDKDGIFLILYKSGGTNETLVLFIEDVDLQLVKDNVDAGINPLVAREPLDFNGLNRFQVDKDGIFLILYKSGGTNETLALFIEDVDLQLVKDNVDLYIPSDE